MNRLDVRPAAERETAAPLPTAALVSLVAGVWGLLLLFAAIPGVGFSRWLVLSASAMLCVMLWDVRAHGGVLFYPFFLIAALGCGWAVYMLRGALAEQAAAVGNALAGEGAAEVTPLALLSGLLLSLLLFTLETLLGSHTLFYLLTTAALLASPAFGIRPTVGTACLLLIFQISFWVYQRALRRQKRTLLSAAGRMRLAGKSALASCLLLAAAGAIAVPLTLGRAESLYGSVYNAEDWVYRRLIADRAADTAASGRINRGNQYRRGTERLSLTVSRLPKEPLYLRGFSGGDYEGGNWLPADDEAILARLRTQESLRRHRIERIFSGMYYDFIANAPSVRYRYRGTVVGCSDAVYAESAYRFLFPGDPDEIEVEVVPPPEDILLAVRRLDGDETAYAPYFSRQETTDDVYRFFERGDAGAVWDGLAYGLIPFEYLELHAAYRDAAREAYTRVPEGQTPRLAQLVRDNPLTDRDEITAFILYTLHSNARYSLTPGWTPINEDAVEYFLFDNHLGYCQHFAAAATLLYRLYGVPARYATGYRADPEAFRMVSMFADPLSSIANTSIVATVTDESAHAWVEIFDDERGWVPVEVTPAADGSTAEPYPGFDTARLGAIWDERGWDVTEPSLAEDTGRRSAADGASAPDFPLRFGADGETLRSALPSVCACLAYLLAALPLLFGCRRLRRLRAAERADCRASFARLVELLRFSGGADGPDGSEPDFARRLADAVPEISREDAEWFVGAAERAAFGPARPHPDEDEFACGVYARAAESVYGGLPWRKKLIFKWIRVYG